MTSLFFNIWFQAVSKNLIKENTIINISKSNSRICKLNKTFAQSWLDFVIENVLFIFVFLLVRANLYLKTFKKFFDSVRWVEKLIISTVNIKRNTVSSETLKLWNFYRSILKRYCPSLLSVPEKVVNLPFPIAHNETVTAWAIYRNKSLFVFHKYVFIKVIIYSDIMINLTVLLDLIVNVKCFIAQKTFFQFLKL